MSAKNGFFLPIPVNSVELNQNFIENSITTLLLRALTTHGYVIKTGTNKIQLDYSGLDKNVNTIVFS